MANKKNLDGTAEELERRAKRNEYQKLWYEANREKVKAAQNKRNTEGGYSKRYREKNKARLRDYRIERYRKDSEGDLKKQRERRKSLRKLVIEHYGNKCRCCGESTFEFLALDHKNRDGAKHRKEVLGSNEGGGSHAMMLWIRRNNFPKTFQILCHNCNIGRERNNGVCPHKRRKR